MLCFTAPTVGSPPDRWCGDRRTPDGTWLYCLTTSGAYEQIHKSNDDIVAEQWELIRRYYPKAVEARLVWSATMESAVQSAERAVAAFLELPSRRQ